jgi:hypothetical protein
VTVVLLHLLLEALGSLQEGGLLSLFQSYKSVVQLPFILASQFVHKLSICLLAFRLSILVSQASFVYKLNSALLVCTVCQLCTILSLAIQYIHKLFI